MGEEKFEDVRNIVGQIGSSPRRRGKDGNEVQLIAAEGITPAWAGKRTTRNSGRKSTRDHPRVGGEKSCSRSIIMRRKGSPPHGRGKEGAQLAEKTGIRITPAWAGKRGGTLRLACCTADHPRMGGEKRSDRLDYYFPQGSPPHGRGKVLQKLRQLSLVGITPAWAGKSRYRCRCWSGGQDHPRMGGEKKASMFPVPPQ